MPSRLRRRLDLLPGREFLCRCLPTSGQPSFGYGQKGVPSGTLPAKRVADGSAFQRPALSMSVPAQSKRIPQLDLLRGIAVLMVICRHYSPFNFLYKIGWAGVDLFFVLSGFLISGLLFTDWKKHERLSIGRFFVRRGFKIYPSFYLFLLLTIPITAVAPATRGHMLPRFAAECFFVQDYFRHLWPHTWSLAVEEQFYILLPLALLLLSQLRRSNPERGFTFIPAFSAILLAVCLLLRMHRQGDPRYALHLRADALFLGVALGYWFQFRPQSFHSFSRWWLLPLGIGLLLPLAYYGEARSALPYVLTCNCLGFALLLCWILPRNVVRLPLLERVGFYSYSIYLWHFLVTFVVKGFSSSFPMCCVNIVACCVVGIYMGKAVECRALDFRDRLFPADAACGRHSVFDPFLNTTRASREHLPGAPAIQQGT